MTDISKEAVDRLIAREPMIFTLPPQETDVAKTLRAQAARIAELEAALATARHTQEAYVTAAEIARADALREAAHECEQVAYSGKYPQDDQSELGCLRCRDAILALINKEPTT